MAHAAALSASALRNHPLAPSDRQTGKHKTRGCGAVLAEAVSYYARVLEKTLEHNASPTPVQLAIVDFNERFSNVFDACDRARFISHFADHPRFAEVYNVVDIATKWRSSLVSVAAVAVAPPVASLKFDGAVDGIPLTRPHAFCLLVVTRPGTHFK